MGVLQDFERRLEGAVEGFFARAFRSGLQPVELAKALQRYIEDNQHVTEDGVVVPNVFHFRISTRDAERFESFGEELCRELAEVVERTAREGDRQLRGGVRVGIEHDDEVAYGRFHLTGKVDASIPRPRTVAAPPPRKAEKAAPAASDATAPAVRVVSGPDKGEVFRLEGTRVVAGRLPDNPVYLTDPTVSREHAAFVRRGERWWVIDLGSTNGTTVNGVLASEHPVGIGDRIELGEVALEFVES